MRPKTRRRFTQVQSKCLAGGYKRAIMITIITITNVFDIKQKVMLWFRYFKLKY